MVGPHTSTEESRSAQRAVRETFPRSAVTGGDEECELCQSETNTSVAYGMQVCPACDEEYLP